jgi:hypothetical protein
MCADSGCVSLSRKVEVPRPGSLADQCVHKKKPRVAEATRGDFQPACPALDRWGGKLANWLIARELAIAAALSASMADSAGRTGRLPVITADAARR